MTKEQLTALGLSEEQAEKTLSLYTEEMKGFVPRSRLQEETGKIAALTGQLSERDRDIDALKKSAEENGELTKQLSELQEKYKADTDALNSQIEQTKLQAALDSAILAEKGRNPKAIKSLLDLSGLRLSDDGALEGLDLASLKASDPYLFEIQTSNIEGTGGAGAGKPDGAGEDPSKMTMAQYRAWRDKQK